MTSRRLLLAAVALMASGCASSVKQRFLDEEFRLEKIALPYSLRKVKVVDRRVGVAKTDISIPAVTFWPRKDAVSPPLTKEDLLMLENEPRQYFAGMNQPVTATIEVLEARKKFESGWKGERETVSAKLRVTLVDEASKEPFIFAVGESTLFTQTVDASGDYIAKLFAKCMKVALYQAAKSFKDGVQ